MMASLRILEFNRMRLLNYEVPRASRYALSAQSLSDEWIDDDLCNIECHTEQSRDVGNFQALRICADDVYGQLTEVVQLIFYIVCRLDRKILGDDLLQPRLKFRKRRVLNAVYSTK